MFEYMLVLCLFSETEPGGVGCERTAGPFYDRQECVELMLEQVATQGIAACRVRYMEEIFDAIETGQQPGNDQR